MYAWGSGKYGQTGLGSKADQKRPAQIPTENEAWPAFTSVAVAPKFNIGLTAEGELYSWGTGLMGELGLAYITHQATPAKITKNTSGLKFKHVAVGYEHSLAISEQGDLYVWGANDLGQLGTGDLKPIDRPHKLKLPHKFISLSAGTKHSMALNEHGFLYIWGGGWAGQIGDNEAKSFLTPRLLSEDITFKFISAGDYCSVAVTNRGKVYTWGSGSHGRLGHGDAKAQLAPKVIDHLTKVNVNAVKVLAGYDHMLLLSDKGEVWSWGAGSNGETGQNTTVRTMVPQAVKFSPPDSRPATPAAGTTATATTSSETAPNGDLVSPRANGADSSAPVRSRSLPKEEIDLNPHGPFVDIASGKNFSIAINKKGECFTWGNSRNGVLGDGEDSGVTRFATKIDSQIKFTALFGSRDHVIAFGSGEGAPVAQEETVVPTTEETPSS